MLSCARGRRTIGMCSFDARSWVIPPTPCEDEVIYAHALHQGPTGGRSQLDGI